MSQTNVTRAAVLAAWAQEPTLTGLPPVFAGLPLVPPRGAHRKPVCVVRGVWDAWPVFLARHYAREAWDGLPGPWPVKVVLLVACQFIPGGFDEWALIVLTQAVRRYKAKRAASTT